METLVRRSDTLMPDVANTFCPGCTHGIITNTFCTVIDEMGIREKTISVSSVGCGGMNPLFINTDIIGPMHGRAPATATGLKRCRPDKFVYTYQGDGDLASIGTAEIVHAAHRGEKISVIFVNNTTYGMTGGQMAPTTLPGQVTTTSPYGRDESSIGKPIRMSELIATIDGAKFVERVSVDSPANVRKAKKAIRRAFECQEKNLGFSFVEILSTCPTNWGKTPVESLEWLRTNMMEYYPIGNFKDYED